MRLSRVFMTVSNSPNTLSFLYLAMHGKSFLLLKYYTCVMIFIEKSIKAQKKTELIGSLTCAHSCVKYRLSARPRYKYHEKSPKYVSGNSQFNQQSIPTQSTFLKFVMCSRFSEFHSNTGRVRERPLGTGGLKWSKTLFT